MFTRSRGGRRFEAGAEAPLCEEACGSHASEGTGGDAAGAQRLRRVGVFWSPAGIGSATQRFAGSGAQVAAWTWTRAIARYGKIPDIDIFAPADQIAACQEQFQGVAAHVYGSQGATAHFFLDSDIIARLQSHHYDILHEPRIHDLSLVSYVRSRGPHRVFPVTCSQMGISHVSGLYAVSIPVLTAPLYPCDAIVCSTQASREALEKQLQGVAERYSRAWDRPPPPLPRLEVIPWAVDTDRFAPRDQATARRDLDLPLDRPILLCIARVRIQDKMDWTPLLLAFERVSRSAKQRPLLVLAGSDTGDYSVVILDQAADLGLLDSIRTYFNAPPACLPSLYAACDIFVSPTDSLSESFGLTIVEAMACGRPVVASDWNGYKELIIHGETGLKVRTDWVDCLQELNELAPALAWEQVHLHVGQSVSVDVAQMSSYLTQLLDNRGLRERMGQRGHARVKTLYSWPAVIEQWEAMWSELRAIASSLPEKGRDRLAYLQPNYFESFSHYASRILGDNIPVRLTGRGRERLAGRGPLFLHPWTRGFLKPEIMQAALTALKASGWLGSGLHMGELLSVLQRSQRLSRHQALMHLMWLAKYDLVSLGGPDAPTEAPVAE